MLLVNKSFKLLKLFFILLIAFNCIKCSKDDDLVKNLPGFEDYKAKIYSGYLDVSSDENNKLHYVFLESERSPLHDPLVLWLNGGPGCSSLLGFLNEHGPKVFKENSTELISNKYNWNKISNVIYLESPVGVGFSLGSYEKYNDYLTLNDNYDALFSFFKKFPEFKNNKFYITGESYAGIYIPLLADRIMYFNNMSEFSDKYINLNGFAVGNGLTDFTVDSKNAFYDFLYNHGFYSTKLRDEFNKECGETKPLKFERKECISIAKKINKLFNKNNVYDIYRKCYQNNDSIYDNNNNNDNISNENLYNFNYKYPYTSFIEDFNNFTKDNIININKEHSIIDNKFLFLDDNNYSYNESPPCSDSKGILSYLNKDNVKLSLNVPKSINFSECNMSINKNYLLKYEGTKDIYQKLIGSGIRILFYSGDTDGAIPFNGSQDWIETLNLKVKNQGTWSINNEKVAGTYTYYEKDFSFVTVLGVGHMVPQWKREEAFKLYKSFLEDTNL